MSKILIREGKPEDVPALLSLIRELAAYEKAAGEVSVTEEQLLRDGFSDHPLYHFFVAEDETELIGIALNYPKYSTWKGMCLFLEDIVVREARRKEGIGQLLFNAVVKRAAQLGAGRLEWQVLDWNEPAIRFYKKNGASLDSEWMNGRMTKEQIQAKAKDL